MNKYYRLSLLEREELSRNLAKAYSYRQIAKMVGRHYSTISREIKRNSISRTNYRAVLAQQNAQNESRVLRRKRKIDNNIELQKFVTKHLVLYWSPEQIAKRLKILYPNDKNRQVSHETFYAYLYVHPRQHLKRQLLKYLRRKHKNRRIKNKERKKSCPIKDYISIEERPQEVEGRKIAGHWGGDLVMGAGNTSAIGTLVERKTRMTLLVKLKDEEV